MSKINHFPFSILYLTCCHTRVLCLSLHRVWGTRVLSAHSNPRPFAGYLEGQEFGADEDVMTGDLLYPTPFYPTINSAQHSYPTPFYPTPYGPYAQPQSYLPPPPGLGFSPHPSYPYPMANAMYPYPPTPAPAPAPAPAPTTSDKTGNRQKGKKQGKQGNKTPQKEKTGTLNTTLPRTSLLRPSKLHFYCHHHGWVTTHGWPSGNGGHHGDACMFMKTDRKSTRLNSSH